MKARRNSIYLQENVVCTRSIPRHCEERAQTNFLLWLISSSKSISPHPHNEIHRCSCQIGYQGTYQPRPDPLPTLKTAITAFLSSARWLHSAPEGIETELLFTLSIKQKVRKAMEKCGSVLIDLGVLGFFFLVTI